MNNRCSQCNGIVTGIHINNNIQTVWVDKKGYDMVNGIPMGRSGEYSPNYISGRQEKTHLPCGCPVIEK